MVVANATTSQVANALIALAILAPMDVEELRQHRIVRLQALLDLKFDGNKAGLGRALGYEGGAFVRQMLDGERPITEKTVLKVHELPGCTRWFEEPSANEKPLAQVVSHPLLQDASAATENRGGKQPVSFDAEFKKMSPTEQRRFVFLWAASFDSPPEIGESLGGIPWIDQNAAPASSQATIGPKGQHKSRAKTKPETKRKLK